MAKKTTEVATRVAQAPAVPVEIAAARPYRRQVRHRQPSTRADRQEFFLPVTGFVWFYPEEIEVINHPAFQRLGRINQLGQSYLVFRGATHKRMEHVFGAVSVVQRMIAAIQHNQDKLLDSNGVAVEPLNDMERRFVRLGALLHDIGHLAAGHTLEDELGICDPHDGDARLELLFDMPPTQFDADGTQTLAQVIDEQFAFYARPLSRLGISASMLVRLLIRKRPSKSKLGRSQQLTAIEQSYEEGFAKLSLSADFRLDICSNLIGNTICADLLDYIYRDWFHVGKPRTFDDRILQYMELRSIEASGRDTKESIGEGRFVRSHHDRFVIALGASPKVRSDGVSAILGLLEWRYELAETVLFHRTKVTAAAMLDRALFELWGARDPGEIVQEVLHLSDEQLVDHSLIIAKSRAASSVQGNREALAAVLNLKGIRNRQLMTSLCTWTVDKLGPDQIEDIKELYGGEGHSSFECAKRRAAALRELEADFGLLPGSVTMYCAEAKPKIAEVVISLGKSIEKFDEYEQKTDGKLSGGHLNAQKRRFRRLWRIAFFIDRMEFERLERNGLLKTVQNAIEHLILPKGDRDSRIKESHSYACSLAGDPRTPWGVYELQIDKSGFADAEMRSAFVETLEGQPAYPTGAPAIRNFLRVKVANR